jgi:hypothetical protein
MKKFILAFVVLSAQFLSAQEADVKKSINTFFEGLHTGDTLKIQSVCHKSMVLQTIAELPVGSKLSTDEISEFYKSIASIPPNMKIEERLLDYKIQIDGSMAHAWTPYEFYVNGKLSHSGTNSFQLFKDNGVWKIVYIIDTRKPAKKK